MALGDWCISIIPLRGLGEGMTNATRCVPTLIAGQDMERIPLSVETLRATSSFGYVRDACNVSVWIVSGYVGDVARYVSTGWWNRERPGTLCSCVMDDELGLRIHLFLSRPIVGNASRWVGSRQSTSLCVIYYN